jgi:hypothetical protein
MSIHQSIINYYGDIQLKLIRTNSGYGVFCCKVKSDTFDNRYIYAIVKSSYPNNQILYLSQINWVSFQTRTSPDVISGIPEITHYPSAESKKHLNFIITYFDRINLTTNYVCSDLPIKIQLLNNKNYPDSCKLHQALETFQCVIQLL